MRFIVSALAVLLLSMPSLAQSDVQIEAEAGTLVGNAATATARAGYSGSGYVTGLDQPGDSLQIVFEGTGELVQVRLAIAGDGRFGSYEARVDGEVVAGGSTPQSGTFREVVLYERRLSAGVHTLTVHATFDVDYLVLTPVSYPGPETPPAALSDADATPATRALFSFLLSEYGEHVLSAQQDIYSGTPRTAEIDYVTGVTGKVPAIGGFDIIDYSPSRVQYGGQPRAWAEEWLAWAAPDDAGKEGIVNLMWHWNAPTDLYNTSAQPWYRGFYTEATSFDFAAALAEGPGGPNYDLLIRDIDAIAVQLQKFADADVPVLWRPLHEAAGGFFWWGAQTGADYVELWRLMYDRLVDHHDLHNLIWVWTYEPAQNGETALDWYPGNDVVDVVGRDFYSDNPTTLIESEWDRLQDAFGGTKLAALTESGTLPDMSDSSDKGIWWSWFNVWNGFERDIPDARLTAIYASEVVLTRDELPDWRSYTLATAADDAPEARLDQLMVAPNPSAGRPTLRLDLGAPAEVVVEVFDVTGRRIARQSLGAQAAGPLAVPLDAPTSGTYLVRVTAGDRVVRGRFVVVR